MPGRAPVVSERLIRGADYHLAGTKGGKVFLDAITCKSLRVVAEGLGPVVGRPSHASTAMHGSYAPGIPRSSM